MVTSNLTPSASQFPPEPQRCNQELPTGLQDAILCGALADVLTESGPRCAGCFREFGGVVVAEPRKTSSLWKIANTQATRELDTRFAQIGNGLFVRTGKRVR